MSHLSHQNSTFKLAKQIIESNHDVIYAGPKVGIDGDNLENNILSQGFTYEIFDPYRPYHSENPISENYNEKDEFNYFLENLYDGSIFKDFVHKISPDLIFIDIHFPLYAIVFYSYKIPIIFISTKILTDKDEFVPPLNSSIVPDGTSQTNILIEEAWKRYFKHQQIAHKLMPVLDELSAQYDFPLKKLLNTERSVVPFGFNLPEFILWSYEFDFPRTKKRLFNKFYIGCLVDTERKEEVFTRYDFIEGKPIIYCSMGTRLINEDGQKLYFLKKVVKLFMGLPQYQLIIAAGKNRNLIHLEGDCQNIEIVEYASQISILKESSLMITHGGGNSLKECMRLGVPVLCYPHDNDQFGNAARVVFHKIGLSGNIWKDGIEEIGTKVNQILEDNSFKTNIGYFKNLAIEEESLGKAVKLMESFILKKK